MKRSIAIAFHAFLIFSVCAQISWINKPRDFQFIGRKISSNKGRVVFEGWITQTGYTALQISQKGASGSVVRYSVPFTYNGSGQAYFYQVVYISAGKINYEFDVALGSGSIFSSSLNIKGIACGDAYLISGQSNSVANSYNGLANPVYQDSFIRSYGSSSYSAAVTLSDSGWYPADGDKFYTKACVGQWGLVFARHVLDSTGIPVCIINAGVGGTPITYHQKNIYNSEDLNTNYGRMLYRAKKAGLHDKIRGIFWFQGESDGSNAQLHDSLFRKMHADWFKDYTGLEKIAVVQVRNGCGGPSLELREKQRLMKNMGRTVVISANGLNTHDGCHYWFKDGYEKLGVLLFHQLKTTLYNLKSTPDNQPLNPYLAYFSNSAKTELCVEMTPLNATLKVDAGFHKLFTVTGGSTTITGGYLKNNKIYLTLNGSGCSIKSINYDGLPGGQPWVRTLADATLISFYSFPVVSVKPLPNISICKGEKATLGLDSISGNTYAWQGVLSGLKSTRANPVFTVPRSEKFRCIMKTAALGCMYDTFSQNVVVDTISPASLPAKVFFCPGDSAEIGTKNSDWQQATWQHGGIRQSGFVIKVADTGLWFFTAKSAAGCKTFDTISLSHFPKAYKHLPAGLEICKDQTVLLTAPSKSTIPLWNNSVYNDSLLVSSTDKLVKLHYLDSNGCLQKDSASIVELLPRPVQLDTQYSFCIGDTLLIKKPEAFTGWLWNGVNIINAYLLMQKGSYNLLLTDSMGCRQKHLLKAEYHSAFKLADIDTGSCKGDTIMFQMPKWMQTWSWNSIPVQRLTYINSAGNFNVSWEDSNGCKGNTSIKIEKADKAVFSLPKDTLYCVGDSLIFHNAISNSKFELLAGRPVSYPFIIKIPGKYEFSAYDKSYCQCNYEMQVTEKICVSLTHNIRPATIQIAHIPEGIQLQNKIPATVGFRIYNSNLQVIEAGKIYDGQKQDLLLAAGIYYLAILDNLSQKPVFLKVPVY